MIKGKIFSLTATYTVVSIFNMMKKFVSPRAQRWLCTNNGPKKPNPVLRQIQARIKTFGPITVADYMREALLNPAAGYYMKQVVFGEKGDFVTAPEVSRMFGEIISVWFINEWQKLGSPLPMQLVELGPGRGTLMRDILQVFSIFDIRQAVSLHMVETSRHLALLQAETMDVALQQRNVEEFYYLHGYTNSGMPVYWYQDIRDVPHEYSLIFANEFFDALPIRKFHKTDEGWREILVDYDPQNGDQLHFVLSSTITPRSRLGLQPGDMRDHLEVNPQGEAIMRHLASRLEEDGGIGLVIDYGLDGDKTDTFRGFKGHQLHDPLVDPGLADLTADVDFSRLRAAAEPQLMTFGPVTQSLFLARMGITFRLKMLLRTCTELQQKNIMASYCMLVDEDKMGTRFKVFALFPAVLRNYFSKVPVNGF